MINSKINQFTMHMERGTDANLTVPCPSDSTKFQRQS